MSRATSGAARHRKKKRLFKRVKGFHGSAGRNWRLAQEFAVRADCNAYRDRRARKRDFRKLWITRLSAACKMRGIAYSRQRGAVHLRAPGRRRRAQPQGAQRDGHLLPRRLRRHPRNCEATRARRAVGRSVGLTQNASESARPRIAIRGFFSFGLRVRSPVQQRHHPPKSLVELPDDGRAGG